MAEIPFKDTEQNCGKSKQRLLSGYYLDDELIFYQDDGYYLATPEGAHFIYFKFAGLRGYHSFHQFSKTLNRPEIIRNIVKGGTTKVPAPELTPPPSATMVVTGRDETGRVELSVAANSEIGLKSILVFADGQMIGDLPAQGTAVSLESAFEVAPEARWLTILAKDTNGYESIPETIALSGTNQTGGAAGTLYAVAVGTNTYDHTALENLNYAVNDAENFTRLVQTYPSTYYSNVVAGEPVIDQVDLKAALLPRLEKFVDVATKDDTIVILVAGHGLTDKSGKFYLADTDTDPENLAETALTWTDIAGTLGRSKARVVLFLDACHSGVAGGSAINDAAVAELLKRKGKSIMILSASKGRQFSLEDSHYQGGVFTTLLTKIAFDPKLRKKFDLNRNGAMEVSELYHALKRNVVKRTNGAQTPWIARNQMVGEIPLF